MQVSDQCVKLVKAGWFDQQKEPSGVSTLTDPKVSKLAAAVAPLTHCMTKQKDASHGLSERHATLRQQTWCFIPCSVGKGDSCFDTEPLTSLRS